MPRVWMHKETGDLALVKPSWYVHETADQKAYALFKMGEYRSFYAPIIQDGWLVENGHGVAFSMCLGLEKYFEDLGEL